MIELVLATHNAGKLAELRALCAVEPWHWRSLAEFPEIGEAPEHGRSFAENARSKALFYSQRTGCITLADDSGLEVDCLGGAPGVDSAHYAGPRRDDLANNRKLVAALAGIPAAQRTARFRCHMALARAGCVLLESSGVIEGLIIDQPRGGNGFGYDPHFLAAGVGHTLAELPSTEKNRISHRGQALRQMLAQLKQLPEFR